MAADQKPRYTCSCNDQDTVASTILEVEPVRLVGDLVASIQLNHKKDKEQAATTDQTTVARKEENINTVLDNDETICLLQFFDITTVIFVLFTER